MALINTIRSKSGLILTIMVIAMLAMLVLFSVDDPSSLAGGSKRNVGSIAGNDISITEYQFTLDEIVQTYTNRTGTSPDENTMQSLQEQAWKQLIESNAFKKQFDELGISVPDEEHQDMIYGQNIHPGLYNAPAFKNTTTKQFDPSLVQRYLQSFDQLPEESKNEWLRFEQGIKEERLMNKYSGLISFSSYVSNSEATSQENMKSQKASAGLLYIPYSSMPDSVVKITDQNIKNYYEKNKNNYKVEENRNIEYVQFKIIPTLEDTLSVKKEIESLVESFRTATDDSLFIRNNSDLPMDTNYYGIGDIPENLRAIVPLEKNVLTQPFREGNYFKIHKLMDVKKDSLFSAKASHILFRLDENAKKEQTDSVLKKCNKVLNEIKSGKDFETLAREHGSDGTATRGGDLGWFKEGAMVTEFNDAVFKATKTGLIAQPIKTRFGYHIIKLTELKTNNKYLVGSIQKEIQPSDQTIDNIFKIADNFSGQIKSITDFRNQAEKDKVQILNADNIRANDAGIRGLTGSRQILRWAFKASTGDVSEVFEMDNSFVMAALSKETHEGFKPIDEIRGELESEVRKELKGVKLIEQLNSIGNLTSPLEQIMSNYNAKFSGAIVKQAENISFQTCYLETVGVDYMACGKIFGTQNGKRINAFAAKQGVLIIDVKSKTENKDSKIPVDKKTYISTYQSQSLNGIFDAVKELADVKDERSRFY
ncbi:MAG: hypothetical protein A3H98_06925 [Bacteroidetes bacterium RIFCSPLOWO2_02_FULL_36_8]|nr:MAG: hypothetical protein A3H98_06925 [Bacteroidetes bacterium RIFCSPLOWO2_02_FULL_36_8]OFY70443.1 MAG: hypothetical protein A3G23_09965 [Bacteroidetes bacterium RIFCSPLOWO2_12_FULL_37_12]